MFTMAPLVRMTQWLYMKHVATMRSFVPPATPYAVLTQPLDDRRRRARSTSIPPRRRNHGMHGNTTRLRDPVIRTSMCTSDHKQSVCTAIAPQAVNRNRPRRRAQSVYGAAPAKAGAVYRSLGRVYGCKGQRRRTCCSGSRPHSPRPDQLHPRRRPLRLPPCSTATKWYGASVIGTFGQARRHNNDARHCLRLRPARPTVASPCPLDGPRWRCGRHRTAQATDCPFNLQGLVPAASTVDLDDARRCAAGKGCSQGRTEAREERRPGRYGEDRHAAGCAGRSWCSVAVGRKECSRQADRGVGVPVFR